MKMLFSITYTSNNNLSVKGKYLAFFTLLKRETKMPINLCYKQACIHERARAEIFTNCGFLLKSFGGFDAKNLTQGGSTANVNIFSYILR